MDTPSSVPTPSSDISAAPFPGAFRVSRAPMSTLTPLALVPRPKQFQPLGGREVAVPGDQHAGAVAAPTLQRHGRAADDAHLRIGAVDDDGLVQASGKRSKAAAAHVEAGRVAG